MSEPLLNYATPPSADGPAITVDGGRVTIDLRSEHERAFALVRQSVDLMCVAVIVLMAGWTKPVVSGLLGAVQAWRMWRVVSAKGESVPIVADAKGLSGPLSDGVIPVGRIAGFQLRQLPWLWWVRVEVVMADWTIQQGRCIRLAMVRRASGRVVGQVLTDWLVERQPEWLPMPTRLWRSRTVMEVAAVAMVLVASLLPAWHLFYAGMAVGPTGSRTEAVSYMGAGLFVALGPAAVVTMVFALWPMRRREA